MFFIFWCLVVAFLVVDISTHQVPLAHDKKEEATELISVGRMLSPKIQLVSCHVKIETEKSSFSGVVSTYADSFHRKIQAGGKRHNKYAYTAASLTFPMGTRLRVFSPLTKRAVVVEVTDRGPYVKGRSLDLSLAAMNSLGLTKLGVSRCVITPI